MPLTDLGRKGASAGDRNAAWLGLGLAVVLAAIMFLFVWRVEQEQNHRLLRATEAEITPIGRAVSQSLNNALSLGIPLADMVGVEGYLRQLLADNPDVTFIGVADLDRRQLFAVRSDSTPLLDSGVAVSVRLPVDDEDGLVAWVTVESNAAQAQRTIWALRFLTFSAVIVAALIGALVVRIMTVEVSSLPGRRLTLGLRAGARGTFADFTPIGTGTPVRWAGQTTARAITPVRRALRRIFALADDLRALDFDQRITPDVNAAVRGLQRDYRVDRQSFLNRRGAWAGWWFLPLAAAGSMPRPLVPGFGADRLGGELPGAIAGAAGLAAEASGIVLAALLCRFLSWRMPLGLLAAGGCALAGIANLTVFQQRDLDPFLVSRVAAGFGCWLAILALLRVQGGFQRLPLVALMLFLACEAIGPSLGALVGEGMGRRASFLVSGIILTAFAPLLLLAASGFRRLAPPQAGLHRRRGWISLVVLAATASCVITFHGAGLEHRYEYALAAFTFAALGLGMALARLLLPASLWLPPLFVAVVAADYWLGLRDPFGIALSAPLLGLALGVCLKRIGRPVAGTGGAIAVALGLSLGPAATAALLYAGQEMDTAVAIVCTAAAVLTLVAAAASSAARRAEG